MKNKEKSEKIFRKKMYNIFRKCEKNKEKNEKNHKI